MWTAIRTETGGRVEAQVFPQNNRIAGSDPAALKLLVAGEIQFFTLMGGILGTVVPVAEVQQVPFAFRSAAHAHQAVDGPLGAYVRDEMVSQGHSRVCRRRVRQRDAPDHGHAKRPIAVPGDLAGLRMRVPAGEMVADTFRAFGARAGRHQQRRHLRGAEDQARWTHRKIRWRSWSCSGSTRS